MKTYAFQLVQKFGEKHAKSFTLPELEAVMLNHGVNPKTSFHAVSEIHFPGWPVVIAAIPNDDVAASICKKLMLCHKVCEVLAVGSSPTLLASALREPTSDGEAAQVSRLREVAEFVESFRIRETKFSTQPNAPRLSTPGHIELREPILGELVTCCGFDKCQVKLKDPECSLEVWARCRPEGDTASGHAAAHAGSNEPSKDHCAPAGGDSHPSPLSLPADLAGLDRVLLLRTVAHSHRTDILKRHSLKTRSFLGPTSMDPELALVMANIARCRPGSLAMDIYGGTGGIMLAAAQQGSMVLGCDIDYLVLRGKAGRNAATNFRDQGLPPPDWVLCDVSRPPLRGDDAYVAMRATSRAADDWAEDRAMDGDVGGGKSDTGSGSGAAGGSQTEWEGLQGPRLPVQARPGIDCIVTDPPYGIRAGAKCVRRDDDTEDVVPMPQSLRRTHIPRKANFRPSDMLFGMLDFAARHLPPAGRIVYLLPVTMRQHEGQLPAHPLLEPVACAYHSLGVAHGRFIVGMARLEGVYDEAAAQSGVYREYFDGQAKSRGIDFDSLPEDLHKVREEEMAKGAAAAQAGKQAAGATQGKGKDMGKGKGKGKGKEKGNRTDRAEEQQDEDEDQEEDMSQKRARRLADMQRRRAKRASSRRGPERGWGGPRGKIGGGDDQGKDHDEGGADETGVQSAMSESGASDGSAGSKRGAGSENAPHPPPGDRPAKQSRVTPLGHSESGTGTEFGDGDGLLRPLDVVAALEAAREAGAKADRLIGQSEEATAESSQSVSAVECSGDGGAQRAVPAGGFVRPDGGVNVSGVKFDRSDPLAKPVTVYRGLPLAGVQDGAAETDVLSAAREQLPYVTFEGTPVGAGGSVDTSGPVGSVASADSERDALLVTWVRGRAWEITEPMNPPSTPSETDFVRLVRERKDRARAVKRGLGGTMAAAVDGTTSL